MNKKHICLVHKDIADISRGGISTLFKAVAKVLVRNGYKVTVITQQDFNDPSIEVVKLPVESDKDIHSRNVTKALEKITPDLAEASSWGWELLDYIKSPKNTKTKTAIRMEPSSLTMFQEREFAKKENEQALLADYLSAVSNYAKSDVIDKYQIIKPISVISNAIDQKGLKMLDVNESLNSGQILVNGEWEDLLDYPTSKIIDENLINAFWVGKPTRMKGFDILGNIVKVAPNNSMKFIVNVGWSKEYVKWPEEIKEKCVFIRGLERQDQVSIWSKADLFLNTSRWEGFGLVLLESATIGTPILANDACTVYHEFFNSDWGKLVRMDNPQEAVRQIEEIAKNRSRYTFTGLDHYDLPSFEERNISFYKSVL